MPSYRTIVTIAALLPGRQPEDVERSTRSVVGRHSTLEAFQIDIVAGQPRVTIRFTGADDEQAREMHRLLIDTLAEVANMPRAVLAKVVSGRSVPLVP